MFKSNRILYSIFVSTIVPVILILSWFIGLLSCWALKICSVGCFIAYIVLPLSFKYFHNRLIFLTYINAPKSAAIFKSPAQLGLYATRNFYVKYHDSSDDENISLGVWHILPNYIAKKFANELGLTDDEKKLLVTSHKHEPYERSIHAVENQIRNEFPKVDDSNDADFYERMLHINGSKTVFYMHGNSGSRAASHRIELYKMLREQGYHVITFDYRGYADSKLSAPTETGVVRDAIAVYKYITAVTKGSVFAWGHSLGTGVGCHMLAVLRKLNIPGPRVLILESPFTNIGDEIRLHQFSTFFRHLPWYDYTVIKAMYENNLRFESENHIARFRQPIMIIHAEDDIVVPYKLGHELYLTALDKRQKSWGPVEFHRFDADLGYGHECIYRAPELPDLINNFFEAYGNERY